MRIWGAGLFDNPNVAHLRDRYRDSLTEGASDEDALAGILKTARQWLESDAGVCALVGFAIAQSELGRLDPEIRNRAVAAIDRGGDLPLWQRDRPRMVAKRQAVLLKARAQLTGPQPERVLFPPRRENKQSCADLSTGDILALKTRSGLVLLRVTNLIRRKAGEFPILEQLDYSGPSKPSLARLGKMPACSFRRKSGSGPAFRNQIIITGDPGAWKDLGFEKIAQQLPRPDAESPLVKGRVLTWAKLAAARDA